MSEDNNLQRKVLEIARRWAKSKLTVNLDTAINFDLGIDGDEVADMISEIYNETGYLLKKEVDIKRYFNDERVFSASGMMDLIQGRKKEALRIRDLIFLLER